MNRQIITVLVGLFFILCIALIGKAFGDTYVNNNGVWKKPYAQLVKDGTLWKIVFTTKGQTYTYTWEMTSTTGVSFYRMYLSGQVICEHSVLTDTTRECTSVMTLPSPAAFYMTTVMTDATESNRSNEIWAAGYPEWQASKTYLINDKVNVSSRWSLNTWMKVTRAGSSGTVKPKFPNRCHLNAEAVVDSGDGTVTLPATAHGFVQGDEITVIGTTNYDATYTLGPQSSVDGITIIATYVAETLTGGNAISTTTVVEDPDETGVQWTLVKDGKFE